MDWKRILFGSAPAAFLFDVAIRTAALILVLVLVLRLLGKRMAGQLTVLELAVMICLGAIVGLPMQDPGRGVALGVALLVVVLLLQRGLGWLSSASDTVEVLSEGTAKALVKDGVVLVDELRKSALSHQELYALLRERGIHQLGEVRRVYLEGCGEASVFRNDDPPPGLCIVPDKDDPMIARYAVVADQLACQSCGHVRRRDCGSLACERCAQRTWAPAVR